MFVMTEGLLCSEGFRGIPGTQPTQQGLPQNPVAPQPADFQYRITPLKQKELIIVLLMIFACQLQVHSMDNVNCEF